MAISDLAKAAGRNIKRLSKRPTTSEVVYAVCPNCGAEAEGTRYGNETDADFKCYNCNTDFHRDWLG